MNNIEPNGVLFHLDDGKIVMILRNNDEWDWDGCKILLEDQWKDLSVSNPFEWGYIYYDTTDPKNPLITTFPKKTCIQDASFLKLYDGGLLKDWIDIDYKMQYKGLTNKILNNEEGWKVIGDIKL